MYESSDLFKQNDSHKPGVSVIFLYVIGYLLIVCSILFSVDWCLFNVIRRKNQRVLLKGFAGKWAL